jgi:3-deoxy-D-manno-octulosonic-acid transferase
MQSEVDQQRIISLGTAPNRVSISGNLKQTVVSNDRALSGDSDKKKSTGNSIWVVGSSHRGEEEIVCTAFKLLKQRFWELRMVLAPRHPQRFPEVEKLLAASGLSFEKKSRIEGKWDFRQDVLFLDTLGDLESFYAEADFAFVGGSLIDAGGHNLLEPARFGKPVLFGPFTSNVRLLVEKLRQNGGGFEVRSAEDLVREITALLTDPQKRRLAGDKAYEVAAGDDTVIDKSLKILATYLTAPVVA